MSDVRAGSSASTTGPARTPWGNDTPTPRTSALLLAAAGIMSCAILWLATHSIPLLAGMAGASLILAALATVRSRPAADDPLTVATLPPDWGVTRLAADQANAGIAICDRAGRLVCANDRFVQWFDGPRAPPDLPIDGDGRGRLADAGRMAWRDGVGFAEGIRRGIADYAVRALRTGTAEDYILWLFDPVEGSSAIAEAQRLVGGSVGRAASRADVMLVAVGGEGRIRAANSAFAGRVTGRTEANVAGRDVATLLAVDDKGAIVFSREGAGAVPLRVTHVPLEHDRPEGAALLIIGDEIAPPRDGIGALAHIEALLSRLPLGLALADRDGRLLFANTAFARVAGFTPERMPVYPGDLVVKEDKAAVSDTVRRHAGGQPLSIDIAVRLTHNPDEVVALSIAGVRGLGDAAVLLSLKDNSEESRLKREVAQATKMQAVGQLAGGVAHDFNNILTAILGYCDLMLLRHEPGDSDYDDVQQIRGNANRAASLTRQLLAFSRQQTLRPEHVQLGDVVADISTLLKRLIGERIRLEVRHGRNVGTVRADPGQLGQVVMNLAVNARDAMLDKDPAHGGTLTIETADVPAADVPALGNEVMPVADYARLSVIDTGTGIAREHLPKIFEPFFTTKETGKGTGLGLSTVYGIVKQSGGYIFALSPPGGGARFDIYLPVQREAAVTATRPARRQGGTRDQWGTGTILIVEDEDMVRVVAERALTRAGYTVETARDGEAATTLIDEGRRYDLIVSDVVMPNVDGPAMARSVRARRPDQPILFMSGYAEEQLRREIDLDGVSFLAKPFTVQQIVTAVGQALEAAARDGGKPA